MDGFRSALVKCHTNEGVWVKLEMKTKITRGEEEEEKVSQLKVNQFKEKRKGGVGKMVSLCLGRPICALGACVSVAAHWEIVCVH